MIPEAGKIYVVAGMGEMVCDLPNAGTSHVWLGSKPVARMLAHGHQFYYAMHESLVSEATPDDVRLRHENAMRAGVACTDRLCWCRRFVDPLTLPQGE